MSDLNSLSVAEMVAASSAGAADAAKALSRALESEFSLGPPQEGAIAAVLPSDLEGPGLVVLITVGGAGLAVILPDPQETLPAWRHTQDAGGEGRLKTLAQELRTLLAPESLAVDKVEGGWVDSCSAALGRGGVAAQAAMVQLAVSGTSQAGPLRVIWPLSAPQAVFAASAVGAPSAAARPRTASADRPASSADFSQLPSYSRSLLKIKIPVSVRLAAKKEFVQEVIELAPGAIIKFEKSCEELLHMVIGGQSVAEGEAVKVGDKFGFRVTGMLMPREHFVPARRPQAS